MKTYKFYPINEHLFTILIDAANEHAARLVVEACASCEHRTCKNRRDEVNDIMLAIARLSTETIMVLQEGEQ